VMTSKFCMITTLVQLLPRSVVDALDGRWRVSLLQLHPSPQRVRFPENGDVVHVRDVAPTPTIP
jgi:hypothetical protein